MLRNLYGCLKNVYKAFLFVNSKITINYIERYDLLLMVITKWYQLMFWALTPEQPVQPAKEWQAKSQLD